jgi:class 3 adenylate cyclase
MYGSYAKRTPSPDYPWAPDPEERELWLRVLEETWGGPVDLAALAPSKVGDEAFERWWAGYLRKGASPGAVVALGRMNTQVDIRNVLPTISVPTLVLHRARESWLDGSRFMGTHIPGARMVELPGNDHLPWEGDAESLLDEIEGFLSGLSDDVHADRVLATLLVVELVGPSAKAAEIGDRAWDDLLAKYHRLLRSQLARFRGHGVDSAGNGLLATFDGPARAVRCAGAIVTSVRELGVETRVGVHTGEVEQTNASVRGITVHIGARIADAARPGEVLVSSTVRDIVAGSGIAFEERGEHELAGVPGRWRLFAASD